MKSLSLVFLAVFAIALADENVISREKFEQANTECTTQTGVDSQLVKDLREGKLADDSKLKEYIFCVNKKVGTQNEAGDVQIDVLRKIISRRYSESEVNQIIDQCTGKKETPQETGYQGLKCSLEITRKNKN